MQCFIIGTHRRPRTNENTAQCAPLLFPCVSGPRTGTPYELLLGTPLRSTAREARKHHNSQSKYLRAPLEGPACSFIIGRHPAEGHRRPSYRQQSSSPLSSRLFRCAPPADSHERLRIPEDWAQGTGVSHASSDRPGFHPAKGAGLRHARGRGQGGEGGWCVAAPASGCLP